MPSQDVVGADIVLHVVNRKSLDPHDASHMHTLQGRLSHAECLKVCHMHTFMLGN